MSNTKKFIKKYKGKKVKKEEAKEPKGVRSFVNAYGLKKAYDFRDAKVSISASDQKAAEQTAPKELIEYIRASLNAEISKIPFAKGLLTLSEKEQGLYSGFFQDRDGQVIEKFDDMTPEIVAKTMQVKNLYVPEVVVEPVSDVGTKYVRIKYGDFELEIKKSIHDFVTNFKKSRRVDKTNIRKAVRTWRRNSKAKFDSDFEAAKALVKDWDQYQEEFNQILYAMQQMKHEKN